jgi:2-amino-4-hydroxy-6-hydroxymethyldihydropteridine diphosphokinase
VPGPEIVYIGLGSNLGEPVAQVRRALSDLAALSGTRLMRCSSLYRSAPVGVLDQPEFVNAVCVLETGLRPEALMRALLDIERRHGRVRGPAKGGSRTLDLDLLLYGSEVLDDPDLTVPHPRLHTRAFVLRPLLELDPGIAIPGRGRADEWLAACADQWMEKLEAEPRIIAVARNRLNRSRG